MVSLILSSFRRPQLLRVGLSSILKFKPNFPLEIIVVNDGVIDETESVCSEFKDKLNIKYIFSGHRNLNGLMKKRVSGFALNVGIKQSTGDIIVLSCPEVYHLNNALEIIVNEIQNHPNSMIIPSTMYFDLTQQVTNYLMELNLTQLQNPNIDVNLLAGGNKNDGWGGHCVMPYLMAIKKHHVVEIGGYAEDMVGYAADDNDFCSRLLKKGLSYYRTNAQIVHLWHGSSSDGQAHWDNPDWVLNYNLFINRKEIVVNQGINWGQLDN